MHGDTHMAAHHDKMKKKNDSMKMKSSSEPMGSGG